MSDQLEFEITQTIKMAGFKLHHKEKRTKNNYQYTVRYWEHPTSHSIYKEIDAYILAKDILKRKEKK